MLMNMMAVRLLFIKFLKLHLITFDLDNIPSLIPLQDADNEELGPLPEPPSNPLPALDGDMPPNTSLAGLRKEYHPSRSRPVRVGRNLLQLIDERDDYRTERAAFDVHYPFAGHAEWQLANWLSSAPIPQSAINSFLKLDYVSIPINYLSYWGNLFLTWC